MMENNSKSSYQYYGMNGEDFYKPIPPSNEPRFRKRELCPLGMLAQTCAKYSREFDLILSSASSSSSLSASSVSSLSSSDSVNASTSSSTRLPMINQAKKNMNLKLKKKKKFKKLKKLNNSTIQNSDGQSSSSTVEPITEKYSHYEDVKYFYNEKPVPCTYPRSTPTTELPPINTSNNNTIKLNNVNNKIRAKPYEKNRPKTNANPVNTNAQPTSSRYQNESPPPSPHSISQSNNITEANAQITCNWMNHNRIPCGASFYSRDDYNEHLKFHTTNELLSGLTYYQQVKAYLERQQQQQQLYFNYPINQYSNGNTRDNTLNKGFY